MHVFLHRANDNAAIFRALELGIGLEVDIRTQLGVPYLNHDPILHLQSEWKNCKPLHQLLHMVPPSTPLLLDFKETGIIDIVADVIKPNYMENSLAIDLIAPDMYYAQSVGLKTLARCSIYESIEPRMWDQEQSTPKLTGGYEAGFWLDYVRNEDDLAIWSSGWKNAYLVSPELHGFELTDTYIRRAISNGYKAVCTDYPERWLEAIG